MTTEKAIEFVRKKQLPYWKLYKGTKRLSQCDSDENPEANLDVALALFIDEVNNRPAGSYEVVVYRNHKGDKSGFRFDFSINQENIMSYQPQINVDQIRQQIETQLKIESSLSSLHEKVNAIGEALFRLLNEEKEDDLAGLESLGKAFNLFKGFASNTVGTSVPSETTTTLQRGISKGLFS